MAKNRALLFPSTVLIKVESYVVLAIQIASLC